MIGLPYKNIQPFLPAVILFFLFIPGSHAQSFTHLPAPKNVIILIGDGMGFNQQKSAELFFGPGSQPYDSFPVHLAVATYPAKTGKYSPDPGTLIPSSGYDPLTAWKNDTSLLSGFTESAAAATAIATGFKTYDNALGMSVTNDTLVNLVQVAKALGKSAGVITSVPFSHATPAGFVAHNATRVHYSQIAYEMLLDSRCDVIMGTGNPQYDDNGLLKKEFWKKAMYVGDSVFWSQLQAGSGKQTSFVVKGIKKTVRDINGDGRPDPWTVITDVKQFRALMSGNTPLRILGCPKVYSTLQQSRTMKNGETNDSPPYVTPFTPNLPTLAEMTKGGLNVLDNNKKGFFLMIEGGAIDWACHANQKGRLIEEMQSFNEAVDAVISWVEHNSSWDETLVIVTADHETGFLWGGAPFTEIKNNGKGNLPGMQFNTHDHSNSLVPFRAKGSGSDLYNLFADEWDPVRGSFIQNSEISQLIFLLWGKPQIQKPVISGQIP